jgi:hypothetical protein
MTPGLDRTVQVRGVAAYLVARFVSHSEVRHHGNDVLSLTGRGNRTPPRGDGLV